MGQGFNLPPGLQLPPDVAELLNVLQNKAMNPSDPLIQNVQQILNNIMVSVNLALCYVLIQSIYHIHSKCWNNLILYHTCS